MLFRSNTVSPGYIGTDMVKAIRPEVLEKIVAGVPAKRLGQPEIIDAISSGWPRRLAGTPATIFSSTSGRIALTISVPM